MNRYWCVEGLSSGRLHMTREAAMRDYLRRETFTEPKAWFLMEDEAANTTDSVRVFPTDDERREFGAEPEFRVRAKRESEYRSAIQGVL